MKKRETYFGQISKGLRTALQGLRLTGKHYRRGYHRETPLGIEDTGYFKQAPGPITIQYPAVKVPVPDTGRYRLHMETDDCIGCDKCARICPVDCITIETFRADGDLGRTSDGTVKRLHLPVFDIDMGKCMFCGLCTTVCPTECLTMTKVYDFSEYDRDNLVYHFGAYSPQQEQEIRNETEAALERKKAEKASTPTSEAANTSDRPRPMMRPKPVVAPESDLPATEGPSPEPEAPVTKAPSTMRPRPMMKRAPEPAEEPSPNALPVEPTPTDPPKAFRPKPVMKRAPEPEEAASHEVTPAEPPPTDPPKAFRPRPLMKRPNTESDSPVDPP